MTVTALQWLDTYWMLLTDEGQSGTLYANLAALSLGVACAVPLYVLLKLWGPK